MKNIILEFLRLGLCAGTACVPAYILAIIVNTSMFNRRAIFAVTGTIIGAIVYYVLFITDNKEHKQ